MENKQYPSNKKSKNAHEGNLIKETAYASVPEASTRYHKKQQLDLQILHRIPTYLQAPRRVIVSIKPRIPAIKTLYITEKSRFYNKKGLGKSDSRLAIGDHSFFTPRQLRHAKYSYANKESDVNCSACDISQLHSKNKIDRENVSSVIIQVESSTSGSKSSLIDSSSRIDRVWYAKKKSTEKCYVNAEGQANMNLPNVSLRKDHISPEKADIATLIITTSSENYELLSQSTIENLNERIDNLERKILRHEMVFRSVDPNLPVPLLDEKSKENNIMRTASGSERPGCSYVEQYSHVPETSAFQRYAQQGAALSPSKASTLDKEHNSEQYGRDFTTYDGITARGRRQCASVPCKRNDAPNPAAERVHKMRHKLNPVRDYRLMDTVHYLAQGEFAPRDDGIKLTPSREAVLSDIIWEDVCRTHWPNARLGRRGHSERCTERYTTRCELQRLIDNLLRERVAHVERRRKRHYRIVKLNHRHETSRSVGKTGDIIVASHKNRQASEDVIIHDQNASSSLPMERQMEDQTTHRRHRSHDRLMPNATRQKRRSRQDDCSPGPSYAERTSPAKEPTCCYRAYNITKKETTAAANDPKFHTNQDGTSGSSTSACKRLLKNPRLVIKKERRKHECREESNLEHLILLPTLVVRTPSNLKRQKKFNELYHRILNKAQNIPVNSEAKQSHSNLETKDIGFNINITLSDSEERINKE